MSIEDRTFWNVRLTIPFSLAGSSHCGCIGTMTWRKDSEILVQLIFYFVRGFGLLFFLNQCCNVDSHRYTQVVIARVQSITRL